MKRHSFSLELILSSGNVVDTWVVYVYWTTSAPEVIDPEETKLIIYDLVHHKNYNINKLRNYLKIEIGNKLTIRWPHSQYSMTNQITILFTSYFV